MQVLVEQVNPVTDIRTRETYFTFWVRLLDAQKGYSIAIGGWRYIPKTRTVWTPSTNKGQGNYVKTTKLNAETMNVVLLGIENALGVSAEGRPEVREEAA